MLKTLPSILLLITVLSLSTQVKSDSINVYVYHDFLPFTAHDNASNSLSVLFINQLQQAIPTPEFKLIYASKYLVIDALRQSKKLIVLWVNPIWMNQFSEQLTYSEPILWDSDHLVSSINNPVEYLGVQSLHQRTLCGLAGHYYHYIDGALKSGIVKLHIEKDFSDCFAAIKRGDADFVTLDKSAWLNIFNQEERKQYYLSKEAVDSFSRGLMISKAINHLLPKINKVIKSLKDSPEWNAHMQSIGGEQFLDLFNLDLLELKKISEQ